MHSTLVLSTTKQIRHDQEKVDILNEKVEIFEGIYRENEYGMAYDPFDLNVFYVYNPESIVKVTKLTDDEIATNLYM